MKRILIQLDTDPQPSSFDAVVAVDAGADTVLQYGGITPENVTPLVHGAIFTRGPDALANTALFIGGSDIQAAEKVLAKVNETFLGPLQVSTLFDPNGANSTAAAAVQCLSKHLTLKGSDVLVLGGTGPVGQRSALMLAMNGASVRIASRNPQKADACAALIRSRVEGAQATSCEASDEGLAAAVDGIQAILSAGAAGVQFLKADEWQSIDGLKAAIDLNAVSPHGLEGIDQSDVAADHEGILCYGALGVGNLKMKVHRTAVERLFASNQQTLDAAQIYAIAGEIN